MSANPQSPRKFLKDNIDSITKPVVRDLISIAGHTRASNDVYSESRNIVHEMMSEILRGANILRAGDHKFTITEEHIKNAIRNSYGIDVTSYKGFEAGKQYKLAPKSKAASSVSSPSKSPKVVKARESPSKSAKGTKGTKSKTTKSKTTKSKTTKVVKAREGPSKTKVVKSQK